jgi:hypothetical protein
MTEHKNIYAALCAAQSEFGTVTKGATNPAFKSKYADLSDVAGVVIPVLNRHGVAVIAYMVAADGEKAMRTEFVHGTSESKVACDVPLIVSKNDMQGMKSATTYAKRIGLESLSGIAPEDDDGNAASKATPGRAVAQPAPAALITHAELTALQAALDQLPEGWTKRICDAYKIEALPDMPAASYPAAIKRLLEHVAKHQAEMVPA